MTNAYLSGFSVCTNTYSRPYSKEIKRLHFQISSFVLPHLEEDVNKLTLKSAA
jgi:hypothetical protein